VTTTSNAGSIQLVISGAGTGAQYQSILNSIVYATTNQDPTVGNTDLQRTVTVVVNDGQLDSATATTTINIIAVDDLPVAQPDAFTITESGTIVGGNLFASNGSGPDTDPDGPPLSISAVNGSGANVGSQIVLASGALLTVNANGTFNYNPNGAFLPTPTAGSGASNTPAHDSFTYTLAGGNTATVTITLTGLDTDDILFGTAGVDIMNAGAGNDFLNGLAGADQLSGGTGNDNYVVDNAGDLVIENAGEGYDVVFASVSYALANGSEVEGLSALDWSSTAAINLTGNNLANFIIGNAGANQLDGGAGADILAGREGNDTYIVDNAGDIAVENAGQGYDVVYASVSYALNDTFEVEGLSTLDWNSTAAINLTGNSLVNYLIGNAGVNVLDGAAGADVMDGRGGNDSYIVDNAADLVIEGAGGGNDTVFASVSYTLGAGQEIEFLLASNFSATTALSLTGNEFANTIYGNDGANILDGKDGNDLLIGQGGADTFAFTTALGANNVDVVFGFVHGTDRIALDDAVFTFIGGLGPLNANAFVVGAAAADASDRIIYNDLTGQLFYDADGAGGAAAIQFATLSPGLTLTASDFSVI
jgi:VCBS repeat-containing protein